MEVLPHLFESPKDLKPLFAQWYYDPSKQAEEPTGNSPVQFLSKRLEEEIRAAKRTHLSCGEVLLPCGLLQKVAEDVLNVSETGPGLKHCTLYLLFEGEEDCRRLSTFKIDPKSQSSFEIYITFKQGNAGWTFLPQFLKKIARGSTVVISTQYEITTKKLYRSK